MATKEKFQTRTVCLGKADRERLAEKARIEGRTQSEICRDAVRWYLDNQESNAHDAREAEVAKAIKYATDQLVRAITIGVERICKMLARQGTAIGTLYELTWMSLPDDEIARATFEQAIANAKQKMRRYVEKDEEAIAAAMQKVVDQGKKRCAETYTDCTQEL